jgi:hypothetical protein
VFAYIFTVCCKIIGKILDKQMERFAALGEMRKGGRIHFRCHVDGATTFTTWGINDRQQKYRVLLCDVILSITFLLFYAKCHFVVCNYAVCHYAASH